MKLIRATKGLFDNLEAQWKGQTAKYEEKIDYLMPYLEHCQKVIDANHDDYFVYLLDNNGLYEGFVHINHDQIKRLPGYTIRALEITLAPSYDNEEVTREQMSKIVAGIFTELLRLSDSELSAKNIKIHMGPLDKDYLIVLSQYMAKDLGFDMEVHGLWLVIRKSVTT